MRSCVIFGGAGYIGTFLAEHLLKSGRFDHVHIADIRKSSLEGKNGITTSITDVRSPIDKKVFEGKPDWIFNLAAIHREPGHMRQEYFETNLAGAHNVCDYATNVECDNIYFTSSISVYGPTEGPTDESKPIQPSTPYGGSKYPAELIHTMWKKLKAGRRMIISRPGVIYGPGDPGNILRMIKAIGNGYFAFPGSKNIYKSYGYIYGLLDSIDFTMDSDRDFICYNYAETPTQPLGETVKEIKGFLNKKAVVVSIPMFILLPIARLVQAVFGVRNPVHPVRVKKAATSTHIVPQTLMDMKFNFRFNFRKSLEHWATITRSDFGLAEIPAKKQKVSLTLSHKPEEVISETEKPEETTRNIEKEEVYS